MIVCHLSGPFLTMIASPDGRAAEAERLHDPPRGPTPSKRRARGAWSPPAPSRSALAAGGVAVAAVLAGGGDAPPPIRSHFFPHSGNKCDLNRQAAAARARWQPGSVRNATPQADWEPHTGPVPILEWHVLGAPEPGVALPRALRDAGPTSATRWTGSTRNGYRGGDPRTGRGGLVARRHAAAEAGRALLRRRLPAAVHLRPAAAAQPRLGRRAQPEGGRLGPLHEQRRSDDRRRLGARLAHDRPLRPDDPRRRRAGTGSGRRRGRSCAANTASR